MVRHVITRMKAGDPCKECGEETGQMEEPVWNLVMVGWGQAGVCSMMLA